MNSSLEFDGTSITFYGNSSNFRNVSQCSESVSQQILTDLVSSRKILEFRVHIICQHHYLILRLQTAHFLEDSEGTIWKNQKTFENFVTILRYLED